MKAVNYSEGRVNVINAPKPSGEGILVNISSCLFATFSNCGKLLKLLLPCRLKKFIERPGIMTYGMVKT